MFDVMTWGPWVWVGLAWAQLLITYGGYQIYISRRLKKTGGTDIKRLIYSLAGVALLGVAGVFIYQALANSLVYFIVPSEYAAAPAKYAGRIRLGGLVEAKSIKFDNKALDSGL